MSPKGHKKSTSSSWGSLWGGTADGKGNTRTGVAANGKAAQGPGQANVAAEERPAYTLYDHCKFVRLKTHIIASKNKGGNKSNGASTKAQLFYSVDTTCQYVSQPTQLQLVSNVVQEYCHPFTMTSHYQDRWVGFETLLSAKPSNAQPETAAAFTSSTNQMPTEPLPFRVVTIRLRPDCHHNTALQAVHEAFSTVHNTRQYHSHLQHHTGCIYQAIGVNAGTTIKFPYVMHAQLLTRRSIILERHLLIRFFHMRDVPFMEDEMEDISSKLIKYCAETSNLTNLQKSDIGPLLIQTQVQEACVLIQSLPRDGITNASSSSPRNSKDTQYKGDAYDPANPMHAASPGGGLHQSATSEYLRTHFAESWSVMEENERVRKANESNGKSKTKKNAFLSSAPAPIATLHRRRVVSPALSKLDWPAIQSTVPLMERIVSELEIAKCTYNTLCAEETCRFGMRPCQSTLDRQFCFQLSELSQQHMLLELQDTIDELEGNFHTTQAQYDTFMKFLQYTFNNYQMHWPSQQQLLMQDEHMASSQTPIVKLPQYHASTFPWAPNVMKALQDVSSRVVQATLSSTTNNTRRQRDVRHGTTHALGSYHSNNFGNGGSASDNNDDPIQASRKKSLELCQESVDHVYQSFCQANDSDHKDFVRKFQRLHMHKLTQRRERELMPLLQIASQCTTESAVAATREWAERIDPTQQQEVPLLQFHTFSGNGCITATQLILHSTKLLTRMMGNPSLQVFDLRLHDINVWNDTKLLVIERQTGKRVLTFGPSIGAQETAAFVHVLQSLLMM